MGMADDAQHCFAHTPLGVRAVSIRSTVEQPDLVLRYGLRSVSSEQGHRFGASAPPGSWVVLPGTRERSFRAWEPT